MPPRKDQTGMQFGKLTVIRELDDGRLQVICECGAIETRSKESLQSAINQDCISSGRRCRKRVLKPKDHHAHLEIAGQKFGKLTALEPTYQVSKRRYMIWRFRCDCGAVVERVASTVLAMAKRGLSPNCGRKQCNGHKKYPPGVAAKIARVDEYRRNAAIRGAEYALSLEDALSLLEGNCEYCGTPPSSVLKARNGQYGDAIVNGIDRIDNTRGYIPGNVVSCCHTCNHAKADMTYGEFMAWINRLVEYHKNQEERK